MTSHYRSLWRAIGLRVTGLLLLGSVWPQGRELVVLARVSAASGPAASAYLLGMLIYLSACIGAALTVLGGHLFDRIAVSARWAPVATSCASDPSRSG